MDSFPQLIEYMPVRDDEESLPPRKFFWDVFSTLEHDIVKDIIAKSHENRNLNEDNQNDEQIEVRADLLEQLEQSTFASSKSIDIRKNEDEHCHC